MTPISISTDAQRNQESGARVSRRKRLLRWPAWYLCWIPLAVLSLGNAVTFGRLLGPNTALVLIPVIGLIAALQTRFMEFDTRMRRLALAVLLIFCTTQFFLPLLQGLRRIHGGDFSAYYLAAKVMDGQGKGGLYYFSRFPDGRANLLVPAPEDSAWVSMGHRFHTDGAAPFIYPPIFAVLVRPLLWIPLPFHSIYLLWNGLMVVLLGAAVLLTLSAAGISRSTPLLLMLSVAVSSFYPVLDGLAQGQADILILFLLALSQWLLVRRRWTALAIPFTMAIFVKITPLLCIPILAVHRRWKTLLAVALCTVSLLAVSIWQAGWNAHAEFLHTVLPSIGAGIPILFNVTIGAFVQEFLTRNVGTIEHQTLTLTPGIVLVSRIVSGLVYGSMLLHIFVRRKQIPADIGFAAVLLVTLAVSPISWFHHYTMALLPILFLWGRQRAAAPKLILFLFWAVGSNFFGWLQLMIPSPAWRLCVSWVVPTLVIAAGHAALRPAFYAESAAPDATIPAAIPRIEPSQAAASNC